MKLEEVIKELEEMEEKETDKYILQTLNFEIGYCMCLQENNISDNRIQYIIDNIINEEV